jgi:hypothetical protein
MNPFTQTEGFNFSLGTDFSFPSCTSTPKEEFTFSVQPFCLPSSNTSQRSPVIYEEGWDFFNGATNISKLYETKFPFVVTTAQVSNIPSHYSTRDIAITMEILTTNGVMAVKKTNDQVAQVAFTTILFNATALTSKYDIDLDTTVDVKKGENMIIEVTPIDGLIQRSCIHTIIDIIDVVHFCTQKRAHEIRSSQQQISKQFQCMLVMIPSPHPAPLQVYCENYAAVCEFRRQVEPFHEVISYPLCFEMTVNCAAAVIRDFDCAIVAHPFSLKEIISRASNYLTETRAKLVGPVEAVFQAANWIKTSEKLKKKDLADQDVVVYALSYESPSNFAKLWHCEHISIVLPENMHHHHIHFYESVHTLSEVLACRMPGTVSCEEDEIIETAEKMRDRVGQNRRVTILCDEDMSEKECAFEVIESISEFLRPRIILTRITAFSDIEFHFITQ